MDTDAPTVASAAELEDARTSPRTRARPPQIELITRGEPRRRWSVEQKQAIAAESLLPGASPIAIARHHGISSGLLYTWRKALLAAQPALTRFARVDVSPTAHAPPVDQRDNGPSTCNRIEVVLPGGTTLRADAGIDPRALRRILSVLEKR
jgi:transposase